MSNGINHMRVRQWAKNHPGVGSFTAIAAKYRPRMMKNCWPRPELSAKRWPGKPDNRRQKSEDRRQKTEIGGRYRWKKEDRFAEARDDLSFSSLAPRLFSPPTSNLSPLNYPSPSMTRASLGISNRKKFWLKFFLTVCF